MTDASPPVETDPTCLFCRARDGEVEVAMIADEPEFLAFLDIRPLFQGHVLVIPRSHARTLMDLPPTSVAPVFEAVQRMSVAVKAAMECDGIFMASNNGVSQSVDHLHVHVIPRRKKDGLRGFMWPRRKYESDEERHATAARIAESFRAVKA